MDTIRWVHLSDIHFSADENNEMKRMRDSLLEKLWEMSQEHEFDAVFITGDLTYQGGYYDFNLKKFIEALIYILKLTPDELFMIPGNHDLARSHSRDLAVAETRKRGFEFGKDNIRQLQKDFSKYNIFYRKIKNEEAQYIYKVITKDKFNVFLMNTAFTSGTDEDEGKLILEKGSFYQEIRKLKDQEKCINIAAGHHPVNWFTENDQQFIWKNFNDYNIDFYLCGHMHKGAYNFNSSGGRGIPSFQCGSGKAERDTAVTFSTGEVDISAKKGRLTSYKWLVKEARWASGGLEGRRAASGVLDLILERFCS